VFERAPRQLVRALARLDSVRALLDEIGWDVSERQQPAEIDLGVHGPLLQDTMENDLETQRYLADTDDASQLERATEAAAVIERFLTVLAGGDDDGQTSRARQ
jgi:hypothetical protein